MTEADLDEQRLATLRTLCQMNYEMSGDDLEQLRTEKLELAILGLNTTSLKARKLFAHYEGLIEQRLQELTA